MRRRIYLMRHGEVSYFGDPTRPVDAEGVALTPAGHEQARAAGRALRAVAFDRVVTSGLPRTIRTAELVLEQLAQPPRDPVLRHDPDLQEFRPGDLHAIPDEALEEAFLTAWRGRPPREAAFVGGETVGSVVDRVSDALERIHADPDWETLLLVAHGGTNRVIIASCLTGTRSFFGDIEQSPGCINIIDWGDGVVVRSVNHAPYDPVHAGPRSTTLEQLLAEFRDYRSAQRR